jgi:hypothetical protein
MLAKYDFPQGKFSLYFFGYYDGEVPSESPSIDWLFGLSMSVVELTHNWGTESDPEFKGYHTGNTEPRGFGMMCPVAAWFDSSLTRIQVTLLSLCRMCTRLATDSVR